MGQMEVISPAGHMWWADPFCKQPRQEMTVLQFIEELLKGCPDPGYTKDNIRVIVEDKPLDNDSAPLSDYGIKSDAVVQMVRKVNGG